MDTKMAPLVEQSVCVRCGFCCDGTLFLHAHLNEGERGSLPEKIENATFTEGGKDYFRLPCGYFAGKCGIYDRQRADVCGSYRCQLLKDLSEGKITAPEAFDTIMRAMIMRAGLLDEFHRLAGRDSGAYFRQVLTEMGKLQNVAAADDYASADFEVLIARCNIFEALLIKHFRSADDFDRMVMK